MVDAAYAVMAGRAAAAALMVDTVRVERRTGRTLDGDTLQYVDVWATVYDGPGRVQVRDTQAASVPIGGRQYVVADATVQLPVGDVHFVDDDRVTVTSCPHEPELVGAVLSVTSRELKTHATMRRLRVSEVIGS